MKVICIDNKNPQHPELLTLKDWIYEGEVYTVTVERICVDGKFYLLAERDFGNESAQYNCKRFIPLSEKDEMEMVKERMAPFVMGGII